MRAVGFGGTTMALQMFAILDAGREGERLSAVVVDLEKIHASP